jgi:hypothetical protein
MAARSERMKPFFTFCFLSLLIGCSSKPDIPERQCLVVTSLNNHKITTWVNDEPVLVCDNVYSGYNKPYWMMLSRGLNRIHFTAERLPEEKTKRLQEMEDPSDIGFKDGSTTVKLIKGGFLSPKVLLTWKTAQDEEESPHWTVMSDKAYRPPLDRFDQIEEIDDPIRDQIATFLKLLKNALEAKNPFKAGLKLTCLEALMQDGGLQFEPFKIFDTDHYYVEAAPIEKLKFIHGKKTIMVYREDGRDVFFAGDESAASDRIDLKGLKKGEWKTYCVIEFDALYFVMYKGKLKPLWVGPY